MAIMHLLPTMKRNTVVMEVDKMEGKGDSLSRRRFVAISAAFAGTVLAASAGAQPQRFTWRGVALGAEAQLQLVHTSEAQARAILNACVREIDRLEKVFSLYRPNSTISRLNANGKVLGPELELVDLLGTALQVSRQTAGAFDVTVQPLWDLYTSGHPSAAEVEAALVNVGYQNIRLSSHQVTFARQGMALTLNGIAQGYITDRIAMLLKRAGCVNVLVHLGETYGAGRNLAGMPWRTQIAGTGTKVELANCAVATSGQSDVTDFKHLFDPRTGRPSDGYQSVSVRAPTAAIADALSTAFCVMRQGEIASVLSQHRNTSATLIGHSGEVTQL